MATLNVQPPGSLGLSGTFNNTIHPVFANQGTGTHLPPAYVHNYTPPAEPIGSHGAHGMHRVPAHWLDNQAIAQHLFPAGGTTFSFQSQGPHEPLGYAHTQPLGRYRRV